VFFSVFFFSPFFACCLCAWCEDKFGVRDMMRVLRDTDSGISRGMSHENPTAGSQVIAELLFLQLGLELFIVYVSLFFLSF
jgi:hypothetical protein